MKNKPIDILIAELEQTRNYLQSLVKGDATDSTEESRVDVERRKQVQTLSDLISHMKASGATDLIAFSHKLADARAATLDITSPLLVPILGQKVAERARSLVFWTIAPIAAVIAFLGFKVWSLLDETKENAKAVEAAAAHTKAAQGHIELLETGINETATKAEKTLGEANKKLLEVDAHVAQVDTSLQGVKQRLGDLDTLVIQKTTLEQVLTAQAESVPQKNPPIIQSADKNGWLLAAFTDGKGKIIGWNVQVDGQKPSSKDEFNNKMVQPIVVMRLRDRAPSETDLDASQIQYAEIVGYVPRGENVEVKEVIEVQSRRHTPQLWIRVPIPKTQ